MTMSSCFISSMRVPKKKKNTIQRCWMTPINQTKTRIQQTSHFQSNSVISLGQCSSASTTLRPAHPVPCILICTFPQKFVLRVVWVINLLLKPAVLSDGKDSLNGRELLLQLICCQEFLGAARVTRYLDTWFEHETTSRQRFDNCC